MRRIALVLTWMLMVALLPFTAVAGGQVTCEDLDPFTAELESELASRWPSQRFTASVFDTRTGCQFDLNRSGRITTASVLKIQMMAGILLRAQDEGRTVTASEHSRIAAMISYSSDPDANSLWLSLGGVSGMTALGNRIGLTETTQRHPWGATSTSARDQTLQIRELFGDLTASGPFEAYARDVARGYMEAVTSTQQWGIPSGLPSGWSHPMKNGFFPGSGGWRINSVGFIDDPSGGGYAVAILSDRWSTEAAGIEAVEFIADAVNGTLAVEHLRLVWKGQFSDDDGSIHQADIEALFAAGITSGCNQAADRFCPTAAVSRGEMAAFIVRVMGWEYTDASVLSDSDQSTHKRSIETLFERGVTRGCNPPANDRFCPDDPVTREQMATFLVRAFGWTPSEAHLFVDLDASPHAPSIEALAEQGVTYGCNPPDNDRFCPHEFVRREQMASFLIRALTAGS